jgi:hypothetical protein
MCVTYRIRTEQRAQRYAEYTTKIRVEWKRIIEKHLPGTPAYLDPEVIEKAAEFETKGHWTGERGPVWMMASEPDTVELDEHGQPITGIFDYEALYFWTSHFVHASVDGIVGNATKRGRPFTIRNDIHKTKKFARLSIGNILTFVGKTGIHVFRAIEVNQPKSLDNMFKMLQRCGRGTADDLSALEEPVRISRI